MPHANIWIRRDNYEKWENIPNKSEFINKVLSGEKLKQTLEEEFKYGDGSGKSLDITKISENIVVASKLPKSLCEHGQVKGQCFQKGCKFGRFK